ncbi:MAG TPA: STAS domain-containing protein [bacterium]|nr:STAS domain-containing protein [bacterium]
METTTCERDGVVLLTLAGELKAKEAQALKEQLLTLLGAGKQAVIFDLGQVSFMSSAGLGLIGVTHKNLAAAGGRLVLMRVPPKLMEILTIAKLHEVLHLAVTEDAAVALARVDHA